MLGLLLRPSGCGISIVGPGCLGAFFFLQSSIFLYLIFLLPFFLPESPPTSQWWVFAHFLFFLTPSDPISSTFFFPFLLRLLLFFFPRLFFSVLFVLTTRCRPVPVTRPQQDMSFFFPHSGLQYPDYYLRSRFTTSPPLLGRCFFSQPLVPLSFPCRAFSSTFDYLHPLGCLPSLFCDQILLFKTHRATHSFCPHFVFRNTGDFSPRCPFPPRRHFANRFLLPWHLASALAILLRPRLPVGE